MRRVSPSGGSPAGLALLLTARLGGEIRTPNPRRVFDVTGFRASAWRTKGTGEIEEKPNLRRTNSLQHGRLLSGRIVRQTRAEVSPDTPLWLRGFESPLSAIESFSVCNSTTYDRNTGLGGRFRAACGSGERSESRTPPILGSFYPQESDSGPRRKWAAQPGIRRSPYQSNPALQSKRHRIAANKNVGRDGEWQSR